MNDQKIADILQIIRKTTVDKIVQDIIGVQPMSGPSGQVYTLRARYDNLVPYRHYDNIPFPLEGCEARPPYDITQNMSFEVCT